jgi:hypothetical protein
MDLFSSRWWANIWAMLESVKNTVWEKKVNDFLSKMWWWEHKTIKIEEKVEENKK